MAITEAVENGEINDVILNIDMCRMCCWDTDVCSFKDATTCW